MTTQITITSDDILIRPWFSPNGTFDGYFAIAATDFADGFVQPSAGELSPTPQQAVEVFASVRWPELAAATIARHVIASFPNGYKPTEDFDEVLEAIRSAFPSFDADEAYDVARKCELEWSHQQRGS